MHLFSGHPRDGDLEDWCTRLAAHEGGFVRFVAVDLGLSKKWDLRIEANVKDLEGRILRGEFDQVHSGVPCCTWSRSRHVPGGPPRYAHETSHGGYQISPVDYDDNSTSTTC